MKKVFLILMFFSLGLSLFSCIKKDDDSTVFFQENFEYATASPWDLSTAVNGWSNVGTSVSSWNIITGGVSDSNALQYHSTAKAQLVNTYGGSDYQISVQFKPKSIVDSDQRPFGLVGRIQDSSYECYWVYVYDDGTNVYLVIATYNGSSAYAVNSGVVSNASLDTDTWYTLTMTLNSSTITGNISGGDLDTTVTATDTTYTSGKVGIMVWSGTISDFNVYFDDYLVKTP